MLLFQMYSTEVEEQFGFFTDFADTFPLYRGKGSRDPDEAEGQVCGYLKGAVKVYPLPPDGPPPEKILSTHSVPSTSSEECVVRVYVVKVSKPVLYHCMQSNVYLYVYTLYIYIYIYIYM